MRNLYLYLLILLPLFCISCYDDKGNYDYHALNQAEVAGIDSMYTAIFMEKLVITPTIQSEDKERVYDYIWMCYDKNDFRKSIDTLSLEKDLDYTVSLSLSSYQLIFAYRDRETEITKYVYSSLSVESQNSRGWYVLKEKEGGTDLDFFWKGKENTDLLQQTQGKMLTGKPRSLGFVGNYTWANEEEDKVETGNQCLLLASEGDVSLVRISDMKQLGDFNSLFFENAPTVAPQKWYEGSEESGFINDGYLYTYSGYDDAFGLNKLSYPKEGDYKLSSVFTKNGTMSPLLFDLKSGQFCTSARNVTSLSYFKNDENSAYSLAYLDMEPIYAGFLDEGMWEGGKGYVVMNNKKDGSRAIFYFDLKCLVNFENDYLKNRITDIQTVEAGSKLAAASCFGMHRKDQMLYFGVNDKLYYYDLVNKKEQEVVRDNGSLAIPSGENIVLIKHWIFDYTDYMDETITDKINKLAVATSDGNNYKLYLFEITANKLKDNPEVYNGTGIPSEVMYMSPYMNNVYMCY